MLKEFSLRPTTDSEFIPISMEATKRKQKKLVKESVHKLLEDFPIYRIDGMVSQQVVCLISHEVDQLNVCYEGGIDNSHVLPLNHLKIREQLY